MSESALFYALIAFNVALYLALIVGYVARRKQHILRITNLREAFNFLEKRLKLAFPNLREGFTWNEAMMKVRPLYRKADWVELDDVLRKYQAYRYAGEDPGDVRIDSIVKLAMALPRGHKK
ncbi:MAG: hypothetical protein ACRECH_02710 [Nitrososphaerales archaeon]